MKSLGWLNDLYSTYEENKNMVAKNLDSDKATLLPIAHSTQNAQIEIVIDAEGVFQSAKEIAKEDAVTIIPVTEDSGSRGNGNNPHPLEDKLEYIAGDYELFTKKNNNEKFQKFLQGLKEWCGSEYSTWQVKAIYAYLSKKMVMQDLVRDKILEWDGEKLTDKSIEGIKQEESFVRFVVSSDMNSFNIDGSDNMETPNNIESEEVYRNRVLFDKYVEYYLSKQKEIDLCYVTGKIMPCSGKHPAKIRYSGDKAKLISANDTSGFTYRGRLTDSSQVVSVGYDTSQKAHNALRWVIEKQGFSLDNLSVVAWEISGYEIIPIEKSTIDVFDEFSEIDCDDESNEEIDYTNESYAKKVEKASYGYRQNLGTKAQIIVMGVEAATTGRLSIRFYQNLIGYDYVERVLYWHKTCFWKLDHYKGAEKKAFIGAPAIKDIAITAFGERNDKLIKATVERLIPCVIKKRNIPVDIVRAAVMRASNPNSFDSNWEYKKALSITCALIRKYHYEKTKKYDNVTGIENKGEYGMALDKTNQDRSYLFGRLLGAAQAIEEYALIISGNAENGRRSTSAERYMQRFQRKPANTWMIIHNAISPYKDRLKSVVMLSGEDENKVKRGRKAQGLLLRLQEIYDLFKEGDFNKDEPLSEIYLLGYNCQLNGYRSKTDDDNQLKD